MCACAEQRPHCAELTRTIPPLSCDSDGVLSVMSPDDDTPSPELSVRAPPRALCVVAVVEPADSESAAPVPSPDTPGAMAILPAVP